MQEENGKRVIIAGGRDFNDYGMLESFCDLVLQSADDNQTEIISGMAQGADALVERYANSRKYRFKGFPANWKIYGSQAGYVRNAHMAEYAKKSNGMLIAFWDMQSPGTKDMIQQMSKGRMPVYVCSYGAGLSAQADLKQQNEKNLDMSILLTMDELKTELNRGVPGSVELFNIMEQHPAHSELRYIWRYPISVGIDAGAYLVPVKEGVLLIPFEDTCREHGDMLLLDKAYLSYSDGLEYMAKELLDYAHGFHTDVEAVIKLYGLGPEPAC